VDDLLKIQDARSGATPSRARPNTLEVDLTAVSHNARQVRKLIGPGKRLFAALKGNAYGFGLVEIARELVRGSVDALSVVHLADAIALREAGISAPILLYGGHLGDPDAVAQIVEHDLITTLVDEDSVELHGRYSKGPIHAYLKIDVGLERLGVHPDRALSLIQGLERFPNISLEGVYTHMKAGRLYPDLAKSPSGSIAPYLSWQLQRFDHVLSQLRDAGIHLSTTLAASSPAILLSEGLKYEAVDPGRLLYGLLPPGPSMVTLDLRPAFGSFRSRVLQVKDVLRQGFGDEAGFDLDKVTRIGVVPIGFADGLTSATCGQVLVRGQRVDIIGTFLEHARIDLTHVAMAKADEVVIIGRQAGAEITSAEVINCQQLQTPAGLAAIVRESVERVYLR